MTTLTIFETTIKQLCIDTKVARTQSNPSHGGSKEANVIGEYN